MIITRDDLKRYLECDRIALGIEKQKPAIFGDRIWKFEILYRKNEFYFNNRDKSFFHKILYLYYTLRFKRKCHQMCSEFPLNVFEEGLVIWHGNNIIINGNARVGKNVSISNGCVIGQGHDQYPVVGNNVELCINSMIIGGVHIADDVTVGAGALVIKDINESHSTWGGVPAKCISHKQNEYIERKKKMLANYIDL